MNLLTFIDPIQHYNLKSLHFSSKWATFRVFLLLGFLCKRNISLNLSSSHSCSFNQTERRARLIFQRITDRPLIHGDESSCGERQLPGLQHLKTRRFCQILKDHDIMLYSKSVAMLVNFIETKRNLNCFKQGMWKPLAGLPCVLDAADLH